MQLSRFSSVPCAHVCVLLDELSSWDKARVWQMTRGWLLWDRRACSVMTSDSSPIVCCVCVEERAAKRRAGKGWKGEKALALDWSVRLCVRVCVEGSPWWLQLPSVGEGKRGRGRLVFNADAPLQQGFKNRQQKTWGPTSGAKKSLVRGLDKAGWCGSAGRRRTLPLGIITSKLYPSCIRTGILLSADPVHSAVSPVCSLTQAAEKNIN